MNENNVNENNTNECILTENKLKLVLKVFNIQNNMSIKKDNNNGKYNFKSIGDIYEVLKPLLLKEKLFLQFHQYSIETIDNIRYLTAKMLVVDLDTGFNETITSKIEIDEKMLMNQMQKVIASKTFLKKTMMDDYFIITEEDPENNIKNLGNSQNNNYTKNSNGNSNKNFDNNKKINQSQINLLDLKIKESNIEDLTKGYKLIKEKYNKKNTELTTKELNEFLTYIKTIKLPTLEDIQKEVKNLAIELNNKDEVIKIIKEVIGKEIKITEIKDKFKLYEVKAKIIKSKNKNESESNN